jgi:hypothetical protein
MHRKLALLLLILLVGCRGGGPLARELTSRAEDWQPKREETQKAAPLAYDTAPFDVKRTDLPPAYDGNDIKKVYESFEQGQAKGTDAYAFRESLAPGPPGNELWYDRDRGIFKIRIRVEPVFDPMGNIDEDKASFPIAGYSEKMKSRRKKEDTSEKKWLLWEVSVAGKIGTAKSGVFLETEGRVPPRSDPLPRDISLLLVCRPRSSQEVFSTATGSPAAIEGRVFMHYYLKSDLLELWVYDYKTGRIFDKKKISVSP